MVRVKISESSPNQTNKHDEIYVVDGTLWFSYSPASGSTYQLGDFKRGFNNHPKYEKDKYHVRDFLKWIDNTRRKPIKSKKTKNGFTQVYSIPIYPYKSRYALPMKYSGLVPENLFDIWAYRINNDRTSNYYPIDDKDIIKPIGNIYVVYANSYGYDWIHLFKTKNEALGWFESTSGEND